MKAASLEFPAVINGSLPLPYFGIHYGECTPMAYTRGQSLETVGVDLILSFDKGRAKTV